MLSNDDRALLLELLEAWWHRVKTEGLPPGIWDLRCAIADDLHDGPAPE